MEPSDASKLPQPNNGEPPEPLPEHEPSPAGGGEGGNPSLWDVHAVVSVTVKNTGERSGQEVVQLYLSFPTDVPLAKRSDGYEGPSTVDFPDRVLRAFEKVEMQPGESKVVTFHLTRKDLSFWSTFHQNWVMPTEGRFTFHVGNSSRSLPLIAHL